MRLVLVTTDFPPAVGGTQTYALELAKRMHADLEDFAVVALDVPGSALVDEGLPFRVLRVRSSDALFSIRARSVLRQLFKKERFDSAFCVAWPSALACLLARPSKESVTVFCAAHGRELLINPGENTPPLSCIPGFNSLYPRLRKWTLHGVHTFFPVSHYTGELLKDLDVAENKLCVHGNGTDPNRFYPGDGSVIKKRYDALNRPMILTVARLVERKGIDTMLSAIEVVLKKIPDLLYIIGGEGPEKPRLESIVKERNLAAHVSFSGPIPYAELRTYYNACDVFVLPARERLPDIEGFGIVFLEASACRKPVIGTRSGGIPDAVIENVTGLLVPPDDPQGLALALIRILTDSELASRLGHAGLNHVLGSANWNMISRDIIADMKQVTDSGSPMADGVPKTC